MRTASFVLAKGTDVLIKLFKKDRLEIRIIGKNQQVPPNVLAFYVRLYRTIFLTKLVNRYNVEHILEHETIHHALYEIGEDEASERFDHLVKLRWVRKNDVI